MKRNAWKVGTAIVGGSIFIAAVLLIRLMVLVQHQSAQLSAWGDFLVGLASMCAVLAGLPAAFWELRKRRMEHVEAKRAEVAGQGIAAGLAALERLRVLVDPPKVPRFETTVRALGGHDDGYRQPEPEDDLDDLGVTHNAREKARAKLAARQQERWVDSRPALDELVNAIALGYAYLPFESVRPLEEVREQWTTMHAKQVDWLSTARDDAQLKEAAQGATAAAPIAALRARVLSELRRHTLMGNAGSDSTERGKRTNDD